MGEEGRRSMMCRVIIIADICRVELAEDLVATREEGPKDTKEDNKENYASADGDGNQDDDASGKEIC
jgi:hypothetical protein